MSAIFIVALFFTVTMLMVNGYFLLGSLPLLILKHDTPMDARFVRGFYNVYYQAAIFTAGAAALAYAFAGNPVLSGGAASLALLATLLRRTVIPKMDTLGSQIQQSGGPAISVFRRIHVTAIVINLAQIVVIFWSLTVFLKP